MGPEYTEHEIFSHNNADRVVNNYIFMHGQHPAQTNTDSMITSPTNTIKIGNL